MCLLSRDGLSKLLPHTSHGSSVRSPRPTRVPPPLRPMLRPGGGEDASGRDGRDAVMRGGRAAAGSMSVAASVARVSGSSSRSSEDEDDAEDAAEDVDRHEDSDSPDTDLCSSGCSPPEALLDGEPAGCTAPWERERSDMERSSGDSVGRGRERALERASQRQPGDLHAR